MNPTHRDLRGAGRYIALLITLLVAVGACMAHNNNQVEQKVEKCLASGGTPIVTTSRGFDYWHGCAHG